MQLLCVFTELIAFFSDFVHFTLKLFKNLYYLCSAIVGDGFANESLFPGQRL